MAAIGHGRSYGVSSTVLGRTLPGIINCGLWEDLERRPPLPTAALVTDIGNDIVYGSDATVVLRWVETCVQRLADRVERLVVTRLPIDSLSATPAWRIHLLSSLIFPSSRVKPAEALAKATQVEPPVVRLCQSLWRLCRPARAGMVRLGPHPHFACLSSCCLVQVHDVLVEWSATRSGDSFTPSLVRFVTRTSTFLEVIWSATSARSTDSSIVGWNDNFTLLMKNFCSWAKIFFAVELPSLCLGKKHFMLRPITQHRSVERSQQVTTQATTQCECGLQYHHVSIVKRARHQRWLTIAKQRTVCLTPHCMRCENSGKYRLKIRFMKFLRRGTTQDGELSTKYATEDSCRR